MHSSRHILALAGALAGLTLAGCYGSTEPATDIGTRGATLHGKGTTGKAGTHAFFEYWPTQYPANRIGTFGRNLPGGVTGPYTEDSFGPYDVQPDTDYSFRLCGQDQGAAAATCAQTRTFRSLRPSGDLVSGAVISSNGTSVAETIVDARSDPSGAHPTGKVTLLGRAALGHHVRPRPGKQGLRRGDGPAADGAGRHRARDRAVRDRRRRRSRGSRGSRRGP